ncbi:MAG: hypothetical protein KAH22_08920 [Thiotrichaceae bacterium]|nr:hypothetical protein [Thiotrichaceae bacterium]
MIPTNYQYAHVIIIGTLKTLSPLHIGTGEEHNEERIDQDIRINSIALDTNKNPYIPASTLRGQLRSLCQNERQESKIYGEARQHKDLENQSRGAMRIYDAQIQNSIQCNIISRTRIDPKTNTAKHHHLSTHQQVPIGAKFSLEVHLDRVSDDEINTVLASLDALQQGRIGQGKTIGQGQISWEIDLSASKTLNKNGLKHWIKAKKRFPLTSKYMLLKKYRNKNQEALKSAGIDSTWQSQKINLIADSPLLINDPHEVFEAAEKAKKDKNNANDRSPDHIMLKQNNHYIIPASTLKGWMRAHCTRILNTIAGENSDQERVNTLIKQLFGGTEEGMSKLQFSDIQIAFIPKIEHEQTFIAIDRFTGGAKHGALYSIKAIRPITPLTTSIRYQLDSLCDWMKILLLYCVRDAIEGDLVIGWGKSKGFGRLKVDADFSTLLQDYSEEQLTTWQKDLEQKLK